MISIRQLNKYYNRQHVLCDINLELPEGQCVAFIGPNGCGKTTLMKCILGLVTPQTGDVFVDGMNVQDNPSSRDIIGFMPQNGCFPENMTVQQTIDYNGTPDMELYRDFQIDVSAQKQMRMLSGGTTQKVSAVLAFLFNPRILILDEPTAGLDPLSTAILKEKIIKEKEKGKLIFITSHILSELDDLITHLIFMEDGRILLYQPIKELLDRTGEANVTQAVMHILKESEHE